MREDQKDWDLKSEHKLCPNPWLAIILDMHTRPKGAHQKGRQILEDSLHLKDSMAPDEISELLMPWLSALPTTCISSGEKWKTF